MKARQRRQQFLDSELRSLATPTLHENDLDASMVAGIAAHLSASVRTFRRPGPDLAGLSIEAVKGLVRRAQVLDLRRPEPGASQSQAWLYRRGDAYDVMTLVLTGKLEVLSGDDEIVSDAGAYACLAERALIAPEYRADFSARITSPVVRLLRVPRADFQRVLRDPLGEAVPPADVVAAAGAGALQERASSAPEPAARHREHELELSTVDALASAPELVTPHRKASTDGELTTGLLMRYPTPVRRVGASSGRTPHAVGADEVAVFVEEANPLH